MLGRVWQMWTFFLHRQSSRDGSSGGYTHRWSGFGARFIHHGRPTSVFTGVNPGASGGDLLTGHITAGPPNWCIWVRLPLHRWTNFVDPDSKFKRRIGLESVRGGYSKPSPHFATIWVGGNVLPLDGIHHRGKGKVFRSPHHQLPLWLLNRVVA